MSKYKDPFEDFGFDTQGLIEQQQRLEAEYNKRDYLIHKVFEQTEEGKELLKMWINNVITRKPVIVKGGGQTPYDMGIAQGMQDFVRGILLTCEKVEKGL